MQAIGRAYVRLSARGLPLFRFAIGLLFALTVAASAALAANTDDLLPPDQAFRFSAYALDNKTIAVDYHIAAGYYLYRKRFHFATEPASVKLGAARFPAGKVHKDPFFGRVETYRRDLHFEVPIESAAGLDHFRLKVTSQGCADSGVCYVPHDQYAVIRLASASSGPSGAVPGLLAPPPLSSALQPAAPAARTSIPTSDSEVAALFHSGDTWVVLASFFGFGLLLAFTPCVLPMLPILAGIIAGSGKELNKLRALTLSLAYVAGMSVTYAAAGIAAAYTGSLIAAALQNPWVLAAFALVFVWLALSMFGFHDIELPGILRHPLSAAHHKLEGGRLASVALMGVFSAVIVSPCVAAPLAGALLYISQTGNVGMGGAALFVMALGMGTPLVVVGVSEGALLPKSGPWMKSVKQFFGVLLLAAAIWIVSPVIPVPVQMLAWAALLIISAMFLRAIDPLPTEASGYVRFWKGVGLIVLLAGVALLIGVFSGATDPLRPLAGWRTGISGSGQAAPVHFEHVGSVAALDAALKQGGRPAMLDFYADWCVSCKEMDRYTFSDPQVRAKLSKMRLFRADVTANSAEDKALLKRFSLFGPPGIIFFDASGRELPGLRVIGYQPAGAFLKTLARVSSDS